MSSVKKPKITNDEQSQLLFSHRLSEVIGVQSVRSFSRDVEASEGTIRKYLLGKLPQSVDILIQIAKSKQISLNWLLLGVGKKHL